MRSTGNPFMDKGRLRAERPFANKSWRITQLEQKPATYNDRVVNRTLSFKRTSV